MHYDAFFRELRRPLMHVFLIAEPLRELEEEAPGQGLSCTLGHAALSLNLFPLRPPPFALLLSYCLFVSLCAGLSGCQLTFTGTRPRL